MKLCGVLTDAFELCLLLAEKEPARYERAALRWHARYCAETRGVGVGDAQVVLGCSRCSLASEVSLLPRPGE
jgi:hypothetical protein